MNRTTLPNGSTWILPDEYFKDLVWKIRYSVMDPTIEERKIAADALDCYARLIMSPYTEGQLVEITNALYEATRDANRKTAADQALLQAVS